jgi:hypothetical protein
MGYTIPILTVLLQASWAAHHAPYGEGPAFVAETHNYDEHLFWIAHLWSASDIRFIFVALEESWISREGRFYDE